MFVHLLLVMLSFPSPAMAAGSAPAQLRQGGAAASPQEPRDLVVLVHGMGRTSLSMLPLERALESEGYEVLNWGYSSFCCSIAELGQRLQRDLQRQQASEPRRVHFVGHSLGNIIIRWALTSEGAPERVGHVVMLAPPNQGSHEADRYARSLGWLLRPIAELRTDSMSTVRSLPRLVDVPVGVIAGRYDGKVLPGETHLPEESAHVIVPASHSFLMFRGDVRRLVVGFLRQASFPSVDGVQPALH